MRNITREMLKIYIPYSNMDWLNYRIVRNNLTYHHILKREHGGKREISNGAILMPIAHQYLHIIECKDIETYIAINKLFGIINDQRQEPTQEQREILEYLLTQFETEHSTDTNSKGKLLIREEYKKRAF